MSRLDLILKTQRLVREVELQEQYLAKLRLKLASAQRELRNCPAIGEWSPSPDDEWLDEPIGDTP